MIATTALALALASGTLQPLRYEDWYPADITPPPGTRYPCALTPLPRDLGEIPEGDRRYINHTYSMILRATQAKLVLLKALEENRRVDESLERYRSQVRDVVEKIRREETPTGLEGFESDVLEALALQGEFFRRAAELRASGSDMTQVYRIPEGRQASSHLQAAWHAMERRYPAWQKAMSESVFHHLCALDLF